MSLISTKCAFCGKYLYFEKNIIGLFDLKWVKFPGKENDDDLNFGNVSMDEDLDSRAGYCDVHCLYADLTKHLQEKN